MTGCSRTRRTRTAVLWIFAGVMVATPAHAMDGYQNTVMQHYHLAQIIDLPRGCPLCHVLPEGGDPLTQFGQLLKSFGASGTNPGSVDPALTQLDQDPQYAEVAADLRAGIDPAVGPPPSDGGSDAGGGPSPLAALPMDPIPQYGCACRAGPPSSPGAALLAAGGLAAALLARRRRP